MNDTKNKRKSVFKGILNFFETILTILIVLICLIIIIQRVSNNEKSFFGYRLFKIESGSMIPKYNINDVILVKEIDLNKIQVGDDLVYIGTVGDAKGKVITHQVVKKEQSKEQIEFYTKGLANETTDPVVYENQVLGIVQSKVYTLTLITNILLNVYSLYFLIILPIILNLFFNELHSKDRKERYLQRRRKEEKEELESQKKKEEKNSIKKSSTKIKGKTQTEKNKKKQA